ncbi:MAG: DUF2905 family protein [Ignavibacteria bacterium]
MNEFQNFGKVIILLGAIIIIVGVIILFFDRIPFLGKLPGDIIIRRKNFTIYIPLATMLLLSALLSLLLFFISRKK